MVLQIVSEGWVVFAWSAPSCPCLHVLRLFSDLRNQFELMRVELCELH